MSESAQNGATVNSGSQTSDMVDEKRAEKADIAQNEQQDGPLTHVHATTFLALLAICLIYFAQTIALVGTGSVCLPLAC